jgi:hypothetical protein
MLLADAGVIMMSDLHRHVRSDIDLPHAAEPNPHRRHYHGDLLSSAVMLLLTFVLIVAWALSVG